MIFPSFHPSKDIGLHRIVIAATALVAASSLSIAATAREPVVVRDSYSLYLPDEALRERGPTVEVLADYLRAIEQETENILSREPVRAGVSVSLVMGIKPGSKSKLWVVAAKPETTAELEKLLAPGIEQIPVPSVRGYNAFAINLDLWGGDGWKEALPLPFPKAWIKAAPGGMVPDDVLSILMPD